ncbi:SDR family NAD(P)-dependent oxidoreductase [Streptomyces marincola]|uniref:SDR family NAD(P)-dependent oxidoreductase n=1 Tax=Streptomyces marincola TaxID=2878388 RepID=UPI001CF4B1BB|nr:glucose 1-dehydrogenase [Streptomyces marincola]UCM89346.1 glucose 1-dehydrogenase [Streptomyces marincola]
MTRYTDKVALVTGGTSGMGLATARRLLGEGAQVVITGRDRSRLDAAVKDLGEGALGVVADAADLSALDALMETVRERYGRLDVLFANAGVGVFKPCTEITEADFDLTVDVNFKGVFFSIQKALPLMPEGGAVVINASWTLHRGVGALSLYSATKAAVHNLARTLAADLAPRGIRVNSISPGYIDTPMYPEADLPAEVAAANRSRVPAHRFGRSEEIADAVAFLASAEAAYINGQDLVIDGGLVSSIPD